MTRVSDIRSVARIIAYHGVRNTYLEDLHCGMTPSSKSGHRDDIKVVTPFGEIPWDEVSRISDMEMRQLMLDIEEHIARIISVLITGGSIDLNVSGDQIARLLVHMMGPGGPSWDREDYKK